VALSQLLLAVLLGSQYSLYYANLHSHTGFSDGKSTPRHAYSYARDTARISILAVTDHGEQLNARGWQDLHVQADSATIPGRFVALAAFEWTNYDYGHINVFNTRDYASHYWLTPETYLFNWLARESTAIAQFNHPSLWSFERFPFNSLGDRQLCLFEMQRKEDAALFPTALDSGWHVGMTANQDNHEMDWGRGRQLTGVYAESLTRSSVLAALRAMRTFGTLDRNLRLEFRADSAWMGSFIPNGPIQFRVLATDADSGDFVSRVDLVTNHGIIADSLIVGNRSRVDWSPLLVTSAGERRYFFVRVIERDGDWAISSPIWTRLQDSVLQSREK
jgi:hypothetical protein